MKAITILFLLSVFCAHANVYAHEAHGKATQDSATVQSQHTKSDTVHHHDEGMAIDQSKVTASYDDFPSLHPLIVHFAIVLIIVAAALQLLNLIIIKKEVSWITAVILLVGVVAAWLGAKTFHPHTHGISDHAKLVLEHHDQWADWTITTAIIASLLHLANLFFYKTKRWAMGIVAALLMLSAYSVSRAGHYGAQLVHIEGIGPQGKYLEMKHHDH